MKLSERQGPVTVGFMREEILRAVMRVTRQVLKEDENYKLWPGDSFNIAVSVDYDLNGSPDGGVINITRSVRCGACNNRLELAP